MDIIIDKARTYPFPCYDCADIGEETPRCDNFMACEKWNGWAHEQGCKALNNGCMVQRISD